MVVGLQSDDVKPKVLGVRAAADRKEDGVEFLGPVCFFSFQDHLEAFRGSGHRCDLGPGENPVLFFQFEKQRLDQVPVSGGDDLVEHLDDGDLGAKRLVNLGHLQADDAATDDQQAGRYRVQGQGIGGIPDTGILGKAGEHDRPGSCGDDGVLEGYEGGFLLAGDSKGGESLEGPPAYEAGDFPGLAEAVQTGGELADDRIFSGSQTAPDQSGVEQS